jgi:hypothetical protein
MAVQKKEETLRQPPESQKKQVPLRLSAKLYNAIAAWAEDDFRSVNGQIEYLLTECVKQRRKNGGAEKKRNKRYAHKPDKSPLFTADLFCIGSSVL